MANSRPLSLPPVYIPTVDCVPAESLTRFELAGFNKIPTAKRGKVCERYEFYVNSKFDRTGKGTTFIAGIKKEREGRERKREEKKKRKKDYLVKRSNKKRLMAG